MPFLKINRNKNIQTEEINQSKSEGGKKSKIGIRNKKKNDSQLDNFIEVKEEISNKKNIDRSSIIKEANPSNKEKNLEKNEESDFIKDVLIEDVFPNQSEKKNQWTNTTKKKKLITKDLKGKPVYLEDTGEKLGIVFDMIYDNDKKLIGYKIKDEKSDSILSFPLDQFDESKEGLIFVQSWYLSAIKTIEELEFKERVSPELTTLLTDDDLSNEELYNIFLKHDDQMANHIEKAISLKELLNKRLIILEKKRHELKDSLMDLTEKRLIKDIDRREFSEDVMLHRRKVNVLDVNIKKCKELLNRLNDTSFGKLGKNVIDEQDSNLKGSSLSPLNELKETDNIITTEDVQYPYKEKYINMKARFEQLEEDYNELKSTVEKLISKGEL
jgi:hypothetical protein